MNNQQIICPVEAIVFPTTPVAWASCPCLDGLFLMGKMPMPRSVFHTAKIVLVAAVCIALFASPARGAETSSPSAGEPAGNSQKDSKLKKKWTSALEKAREELRGINDGASAEFVGKILESLDRPDGMTPSALVAHGDSMKQKTRDLVRAGAMESGSIINLALWLVTNQPGPGVDGPVRKNPIGSPGPGGLVLYLPFDTPDKEGVIPDESGAGHNGHVFGATWVAEGRTGGAYRFNITHLTDRIVVPNSELLNPDTITLAAWIKSTDTDGFWNRIIDKDWRKGYNLNLGGDFKGKEGRGKVSFEPSRRSIISKRTLGDGQWHHVAGTYDGQVMRVYVDGVEDNQKTANPPGLLKKNNWDLCIGNSEVDHGTGEFLGFDGLIDEVRIYNRALTADEIRALCESQSKVGRTSEAAQPSTSSGLPSTPSPADRIKQIKQLLEQGLIDEQEYDRRVKEILDAI